MSFQLSLLFLKIRAYQHIIVFFSNTKLSNSNVDPRFLKTVCEYTATTAFQMIFPVCRIFGCLFQLVQTMDKRFKTSDLSAVNACDYIVKMYTLALRALVFVEFHEIYEDFIGLISLVNCFESHNGICNYFFSTHLDCNCRFSPEIWVSQNIIGIDFLRANNAHRGVA